MSPSAEPDPARWAPDLGAHRLLGDGRTALLLRRDATVDWWCAPCFDDPPLAWQLLDAAGGRLAFPAHEAFEADDAPAGSSTRTVLRGTDGLLEVRDGLLPRDGGGVALVRLLRRSPGSASRAPGQQVVVEHVLRLGGFDAPPVALQVDGGTASGTSAALGPTRVQVRGGTHVVRDGTLHTTLRVGPDRWTALVVEVGDAGSDPDEDVEAALDARDASERARLAASVLPRLHPERALDALAVLRACTYAPTGAVVAAVTTSLPEAPGADRQFDYRYSWLRDASLSTAVAALLGQGSDAQRYLDYVHQAWGDGDGATGLLGRPVLSVRGGPVPPEREVDGVSGWAGSRPVRVGNGAAGQRQHDALGLLVEAVSVHVQVGGPLESRTWELVRRLADEVARDAADVVDSNGIWEQREQRPLLDADLGRWLVLDRALWIARGWRPLTRRRSWKRARAVVAARVLAAFDDERGLLPQAHDDAVPRPDASALMAVAFGLLGPDDPRGHRLVDGIVERLGSGPYVYRYPPGGDGFAGREGAFLPVSFLLVTALAQLGRVDEARARLDALCARLPRLLAEEVDPDSGRLLGNTPLVWSHAELARALYVLDASVRRQRWTTPGLWAWRLWRYVALRRRHPGR